MLQVPFFFKHAVDALSIDPSGLTTAPYLGLFQLTPVALLLGYGISRWATAVHSAGCRIALRVVLDAAVACHHKLSCVTCAANAPLLCALPCSADKVAVPFAGSYRAGAAFCGEMRNVVFARVSQSVIRNMGREVRLLGYSTQGSACALDAAFTSFSIAAALQCLICCATLVTNA